MRHRRTMKEWTAAIILAFVTAVAAAATLFLLGPMLLESRLDYERHSEVPDRGWRPVNAIDFYNVDSIAKADSTPKLCIRYGNDAPRMLALSITGVLPDGSERQDTLRIELRDMYGASLGSRGRGVSELLYPFAWTVDVADCRLLEIAPLTEVKGILSVGLLIDNEYNNENHESSEAKRTEI